MRSATAFAGTTIKCTDLLEKLPVGAYLCDPEGLITYYNPRAVEIWGRAPRLNHPDDRFCGSLRLYLPDGSPLRHDRCWMALALHNRSSYEGEEIIIERPDGRHLTALAHANPIRNARGNIIGAVNVLMDITERRHTEEAHHEMRETLAHIDRLSLAGEMAAGLAHELNQPLTAIINYSEACINQLRSGGDVEDVITMLKHMADQGRWAGDVIQRLRSFTRKTSTQRVAVDLNALVRETVGFIATDAYHAKVDLRVETVEQSSPVIGDRIQIQQVLLNLLRNSLEAMSTHTSGHRQLRVQTSMTSGDSVLVEVSDTGPGIAGEVLVKLFHPFVTTKPDGMGLGLSISKSIIDAHGGALWASHNAGQGASFRFTLPRAEEDITRIT